MGFGDKADNSPNGGRKFGFLKYLKIINMKMTLSLILFFSMSGCCFAQRFPLEGTWVNTQYEALLKNSDKQLLSACSPIYIVIDSIGRLEVMSDLEHKFQIGTPIKINLFGKSRQYLYGIKEFFYISEIFNHSDFFSFGINQNTFRIIFKKIQNE